MLIFTLYGSAHPDPSRAYARLLQRKISWRRAKRNRAAKSASQRPKSPKSKTRRTRQQKAIQRAWRQKAEALLLKGYMGKTEWHPKAAENALQPNYPSFPQSPSLQRRLGPITSIGEAQRYPSRRDRLQPPLERRCLWGSGFCLLTVTLNLFQGPFIN